MAQQPKNHDFSEITKAQQSAWATGDFSVIALSIMPASEALVLAVDPHAGQRVLDVACGSGNTALVAARRHCDVTGVDYVPALLERARLRAAAEGTSIEFSLGDAQALPFPDRSFDVVLSTFGVMFAPDQEAAAAELIRVSKPGAKLGLASWVPEGGAAEFFHVLSEYAPGPPPAAPPTRWGVESGVRELLGSGIHSLEAKTRIVTEHFRSIDHAIALFRDHFGPARLIFEALDDAGQERLRRDLTALFERMNSVSDGSLALPFEYLEVVAMRTIGR
jgi:SAM-dependent methyltransferase